MTLINHIFLSISSLLMAGFISSSMAAPSTDTTQINGLHLDWLDKAVDPQQDFFSYANGNWQKMNPVPDAHSRWSYFNILQIQNYETIKNIIESAANKTNPVGSNAQKVGDLYFSGMDEKSINSLGIQPLQSELNLINNIKNLTDLQTVISHLHLIGVNAIFEFGQMQDFKNSQQVIGVGFQGGLGLPDRDYYLKSDEKFVKIREAYVQHIASMFALLGDNEEASLANAKVVLNIETTLAKAALSKIELRDPHAIYHMMTLNQLQKITPDFSWAQYFINLDHPEIKQINLATPNFFKVMNQQWKQIPLDQWKTYLRWQLINTFAPYLSESFVNQDFKMTSILTGSKTLLPRWMRVIDVEDDLLGFAVGQLYVEKDFSPNSREQVEEIVLNIRNVLKDDLKTLRWMQEPTRLAAIKKLDVMQYRIGYPDQWRDYSLLDIDRGPYVLNVIRGNEFLSKRDLNKIGKPVDKTEWEMTPQTVNAYYDPSNNSINLPAGILQPPFFDKNATAAVNYGSIGFIIGHEITHGFDDQGAQFDGNGELNDWWTAEDLKTFQAATKCISDQFSTYTVSGNIPVQGQLVTGEATADLGGLILAYQAFQSSKEYKDAPTIAGFSPTQQFFLGAAHTWASNSRPEEEERLVVVDPHPPAKYRVNGTMVNIPQFFEAFNIVNASTKKCEIW